MAFSRIKRGALRASKTRPSLQEVSLSAPLTRKSSEKKKDIWDKAAVVASILSSVVLASLALFLNSTIQKTQIEIQKSQLDESERNARLLERTQNAKATTDLIQYLLSGDPPRQQIALVALRRAVQDDDDLVINIVSVVASTSKDPAVFRAATETLQASRDPRVANILTELALKESRGKDTVKSAVAYQASQRVAVQAAATNGTTILYAAPPGGVAIETASLRGGVFTHSLISTLNTSPGPVQSGTLNLNELSNYIDREITEANVNQPLPFIVSSGTDEIPIWGPATKRVRGIAIGVSRYADPRLQGLEFTASDARSFAALMQSHGAPVSVLTDESATKAAILRGIDQYADPSNSGDTFILYFAGHGWNWKGIQQLAAADMKFTTDGGNQVASRGITPLPVLPQLMDSLALSDVMQHINKLPFRFKLVVIDACSVPLDMR